MIDLATPSRPPAAEPRTPRFRGRWVPYVLSGPSTVLLALAILLPLGNLALISLYRSGFLTGMVPDFQFGNYATLLTDGYYLGVIGHTVLLAVAAMLTTALIGIPVALVAWSVGKRLRSAILIVVLAPILISAVVRTLGWVVIIGPGGIVGDLFESLGMRAPAIQGTDFAVILGLANVLMPFMVLSVMSALRNVPRSVVNAARNLGARDWYVYLRVVLPMVAPGIVAGALVVFSLAATSYVTPAMLGGGGFTVLPVQIYEKTLVVPNLPLASAMGVVLGVIVLFVVMFQMWFAERRFRVVMTQR